jgi:hypothetical protein
MVTSGSHKVDYGLAGVYLQDFVFWKQFGEPGSGRIRCLLLRMCFDATNEQEQEGYNTTRVDIETAGSEAWNRKRSATVDVFVICTSYVPRFLCPALECLASWVLHHRARRAAPRAQFHCHLLTLCSQRSAETDKADPVIFHCGSLPGKSEWQRARSSFVCQTLRIPPGRPQQAPSGTFIAGRPPDQSRSPRPT